ncbi:hypothetical protein JCM11251_005107 [Rhodosporidiobolus azoricus]
MPRPTGALRQAAQATQAAFLPSRSLRTPSSTPPHPSHWIQLRQTKKSSERPVQRGVPELPRRNGVFLDKPPFCKVKDPAVFRHPSLKGYFLKEEKEGGGLDEESMRARRKSRSRGLATYERHELIGKEILELIVTELLYEKYNKMSLEEIEDVRDTLLSDLSLAQQAQHYNLISHLRADPVSVAQVSASLPVRASLFRSYTAGIHFQHGMQYCRQWMRQLFRSAINEEYEDLRARLAVERRHKTTKEKKTGPDAAMYNLNEWLKKREVEPTWRVSIKGKIPNQVYKAELSFLGSRFLGGGRTVKAAKNQAAALAMGLRTQTSSIPDLDTRVWGPRLYTWCQQRQVKLKPQFTTEHVQGGLWNAAKAALVELAPDMLGKWAEEDANTQEDMEKMLATPSLDDLPPENASSSPLAPTSPASSPGS